MAAITAVVATVVGGAISISQAKKSRDQARDAQQTAQDTARQTAIDQAAAMTGQYTLTGPSIGYNPYESGQYASSPYGTAGVPEMGGITTIPVPATYKAPGTT